jgi:hypothetical protein
MPVRDIIEAATAVDNIRMVLCAQESVRSTCQLAVMRNSTSLISFFLRSSGRRSASLGHSLHCDRIRAVVRKEPTSYGLPLLNQDHV